MSLEIVDRFGPVLDYPPFKEFVNKQKFKKSAFRALSVALGVIGVGGSIAGGVALIVTGVQWSSAARFVSGCVLIPVGLPAFIIGSVAMYGYASREYDVKDPSQKQVLEAFDERENAQEGQIDQKWRSWFGENYGRHFVDFILEHQSVDAPLTESWISILHRRAGCSDAPFLFRKGFWKNPSQESLKGVSLLDATLFFQHADPQSYINVSVHFNACYTQNRKSITESPIVHALAANPPPTEVMQILAGSLSKDFIQAMINLTEDASDARTQWTRLQEKQAKIDETYVLSPRQE